jgi:hypothetical protein
MKQTLLNFFKKNNRKPTLQEFVAHWQREAEIHLGKHGQPSPQKRQNELVSLTVNTALEAIVFRHLKAAEATSESVIRILSTELKLIDDAGRKILAKIKTESAEDILKELRDGHHIITVKNLVPDGAVEAYEQKLGEYHRQKILYTEHQLSSPNPLHRPEDPRIAAFNQRFGKFYTLYETGEKPLERLLEKGGVLGRTSKIRDVNRITSICQTPTDEQALVGAFSKRFESENQFPTFFDRGWQIKTHGYMDHKLCVALKYGFTKEDREDLARGGVAEIKLTSPQMHASDAITRPAYRVLRRFEVEDEVDSKVGAKAIIDDHNKKFKEGRPADSALVKLVGSLEEALRYYEMTEIQRELGISNGSKKSESANVKTEMTSALKSLDALEKQLELCLQIEIPDTESERIGKMLNDVAKHSNSLILKMTGAFLSRSSDAWKQHYFEEIAARETKKHSHEIG